MQFVKLMGQVCVRLFIAACVFLLCFFVLMFLTTIVGFAFVANLDDVAADTATAFSFGAGMCLVACLLGSLLWWRDATWFGAAKHTLFCALFASTIGVMIGMVLTTGFDFRQDEVKRMTFLITLVATSLIGGSVSAFVLTGLRALFIRLNNAPPPPSPLFGVSAPAPRAAAGSQDDPSRSPDHNASGG